MTPMLRRIFYRNKEALLPSDPWTLVAESDTETGVEDELASWTGPSLRHGDLARVWSEGYEDLLVFDEDRAAFVNIKRPSGCWSWPSSWSKDWTLFEMLKQCSFVDRRRLALAACDCAQIATDVIPAKQRALAQETIDVVRRWARGISSVNEVREAWASASAAGNALYNRDPVEWEPWHACVAAQDTASAVTAPDKFYAQQVSDIPGRVMKSLPDRAEEVRKAMRSIIWRRIPLSVLACSVAGLRDPLPLPRDNPRRRR